MASTLTSSPSIPHKINSFIVSSSSSPSLSTIPLTRNFNFLSISKTRHHHRRTSRHCSSVVKALTLDFSGSFFEGGVGEEEPPPQAPPAAEEKEEPQCPPGLRQYETMAVLRPDMSEDERLSVIQRYEELIVAGGGMYVEVFNRGVIPLAYSIKKKNKAGETNTYLDGIYLLFTYFTKPESLETLERRLKTDDDVIRSSSFKIRKMKY